MKELERTLKAVANKRRLAILAYLKKNREATVGQIAEAIHLSFRSTSKHLGILGAADIVEKEQRGIEVHYSLSSVQPSAVKSILNLI